MNIIIMFYATILIIGLGFLANLIYDHWKEFKELFKKGNK